jgi:hypothetical protein
MVTKYLMDETLGLITKYGSIPTIKDANMGFGRGGRCLWGGSKRCIHLNKTHNYTTKHGTQLCSQQHKHHGPLGELT